MELALEEYENEWFASQQNIDIDTVGAESTAVDR
ncbi:hypothetical protein NTE_03450 [Candidatus Nitrososphaera evergladensis SR1]|uniref:Uncharacterized protein n=1 Tax=Candidatus Nitrososphaera evergladensis SR1 TaxID=1459636 RepID=A0A075MWH3_9ARCH|nr:hypothetical protein NTE_03450 [Candidatus Nitrososphaera evergladensis SR1]